MPLMGCYGRGGCIYAASAVFWLGVYCLFFLWFSSRLDEVAKNYRALFEIIKALQLLLSGEHS